MSDIGSQETSGLSPEMQGRVGKALDALKGERGFKNPEPHGLVSEFSRFLLPAVDKYQDKSLLSVACGHFAEGSAWAAAVGANAYGVDWDDTNFSLGQGFVDAARRKGAIEPDVHVVTKKSDARTSDAYKFDDATAPHPGKFNIMMMRHPHMTKSEGLFAAITQSSIVDGLTEGGTGYTTFYSEPERNLYTEYLTPFVEKGIIQMGITDKDGKVVLSAEGGTQSSLHTSGDNLIVGFTKLREPTPEEQEEIRIRIEAMVEDRQRFLTQAAISLRDLAK